MNEEYVEIHSNKKIKYIGLRFSFKWGDLICYIFFLDFAKKINLFYLIMQVIIGDFTYIDDVTNILVKLLNKNFKIRKV